MKKYYFHVNLLLTLASLTILNFTGGVGNRIGYFFNRTDDSVSFLIKVASFYIMGNIFAVLLRKFFKIDLTENQKPSRGLLIFVIFTISFSIFITGFFIYLKLNYPLEDTFRVFYTAMDLLQGAKIDKGIIKLIFLMLLLVAAVCFALLPILLDIKKNKIVLSIKNIRINLIMLYPVVCTLVLVGIPCGLYEGFYMDNIVEFYKNYKAGPIDSQLYIEEYKTPKLENIVFPEKKKNLLLIFAESMETSFFDKESGGLLEKNLLPNLMELAEKNINFSHNDKVGGFEEAPGVKWTVASMLAQFSGLPYNLMHGSRNRERTSFVPNAVTLTDVLHENQYKSLFLMGSDKAFGGRYALLETHGSVEIHDHVYYHDNNFIPQDYHVFWGFEDERLFSFAKHELETLSADEPFFLGLLTVDTHSPEGYKCEKCPSTEERALKNTILCSDKQITDFVDWCSEQSWYEDTVIAIIADHLFMGNIIPNEYKSQRRCINIFINSGKENLYGKNRRFSAFDMYPTILASMGCTIKDNKLGFGVNLFSDEKTLLERYSIDYLNTELLTFNKQYLELEGVLDD